MRETLQWHPAAVRAHRDLSPSVREFELRPEGGVRPWTAGSHLDVRVTIAGRAETRSYSLVGHPGVDGDAYRIAVRRAQPGRGGSRFMWALETGDELLIGEPNNHFELAFGAPQVLLVAGGIGITPIVGMALQLAERRADLRLCFAARSAPELVYADLLAPVLGERMQTFVGEAGERLDLAAEIDALAPGATLYACGPLRLLEAARAAWDSAGRPAADLRFETFGNSGAHAAEPFWVELPRHGLRLEVPAERSLLDVLEEAGVATLNDCRRGECGLCALDIVSVSGSVDHRDVFFSAAQKRANERLCACVSRVAGGGIVLDTAYRPED
ncbi:MAG: oxidoreductase [Ideonella sp.]|nr:oxidoreductase [Ideonella sp.]